MIFLRSVLKFPRFLNSNWSSDFCHAEAEVERKGEEFCGVKFYESKIKIE